MRVNYRRLLRHIYIALFESRRRGIKVTPQRLLFLAIFLFILVPICLPSALLGWFLDDLLFSRYRQVNIRQPVFIIGNMRSGTTLLHRLMAQDSRNFCHLKAWELGFAPSITQRKFFEAIAKVDAVVGGLLARLVHHIDKRLFGQIKLHSSSLFKAEEDDLILLYVWSSTFSLAVFPYPDEVLDYIINFDDLSEERERVMPFYKSALQRHLHHHHAEDKHILSKNPVFSSRVDALYETFPDARFIYLIRNPLDVLGSMGSYAKAVWSGLQGCETAFPYNNYIWETVEKWYGYTLDRLEQAPPESNIIINFDELTRNPREVVTRIYAHFGLELSPKFDQTLVKATEHARAYESKHDYSFEDSGFVRKQVVEEFGHLIERFGFEEEDEDAGEFAIAGSAES